MRNRNRRDAFDIRHFVIPSSFVIRHSSFSIIRHSSFRAEGAFTVLELLVVISIIIVLAGLILGTMGYVQKKGARSRAEAEIAAMSAALESYKADNGIYPRSSDTDALDPTTDTNASTAPPNNYTKASLYLYEQLSGDSNADLKPPAGTKSYFSFKPQMLSGTKDTSGNLTSVTSLRDPFGNSYGYSTMKASDPAKNGYNPTFDLWSTANANPPADQNQWIKNW
jgi:general secretion pathway protein G